MTWEHSCGAVVFTRQDGQLRFVLAHQTNGAYSFPKGHMEPGETERQTALREIREETGLRPRLLDGFRVESTYAIPSKSNTWKRVTFFLAEYEDQQIVHQRSELIRAPLVTFEEALRLFQHEENRRILREAVEFLRKASK